MKIRSHLLQLVTVALVPLLVVCIGLTAYSWWQRRDNVEVRQLERVRAMTIALDTELQASIRVLRVLGMAPGLEARPLGDPADGMRAVLASQPLWSVLATGDAEWKQVLAVTPEGPLAQALPIDEEARARAVRTRLPAVSGLVSWGDRHVTQIVVPVLEGASAGQVLMVAIDQRAWLQFMSQYPVGAGGLMTLLDQHGHIIARTLNNDAVVGKDPAPVLLERSRKSLEGAYRSVTLEGDPMYSAHSRSVRWGWTVATGIPAASVDAALRESTLLLLGAGALSIVLAVLLAFFIGRRIERPIAALGDWAHALARGDEPPPEAGAGIAEVREVAAAFQRAGTTLRERERALNAALEGEQRARLEAEQASHAKDEFLAMLGHELRNPLNAITSAVAVMDRSGAEGEQGLRAREIIGRQIAALRDLVDDLLDVARVTRGKITLHRKLVDLGQVASRAVSALAAAGRLSQHHVKTDLAAGWVLGDETRLEQVVTNLLDNAAKYTPAGGVISVKVRTRADDVLLEVEDTGMGIPPELLPRVFELFTQGERTLDRSQGGLGLGLALVRRLAEMHGGKVTAHSEGAGHGARFCLSLPSHDPPPLPAAAPAPNPAADKKLRILIVEDNADGRETLALMLGMQGHEVHEAEDGPSGVDRALQLHPDAAIVDIGLPGFDGYEVARRVRAAAKGAAIRLVALTGYGQEEDRRAAFAAGFDSFLVKPADLKALFSILATV
ncbi:MAG TPA: ATP-binding protein [Usitatibacter sp.]|nr:ATP-binding protein [Usitatibacter sp.]